MDAIGRLLCDGWAARCGCPIMVMNDDHYLRAPFATCFQEGRDEEGRRWVLATVVRENGSG